jgi:DNA replication protein DnaC
MKILEAEAIIRRRAMSNQMTIDKLNTMKLYGMALAFQEQLESPRFNELSFEDRFGMIIDKEMTSRENRRLKTLLRKSKLRYSAACIEEINFRVHRGLERDQVVTLARCEWVERKHNIIITGPTGVGKTYLACAFGNSACRSGISTFYVRLPTLLKQLSIATNDGSYGKLVTKFARIRVLIVDDWGFDRLTDQQRVNYLDIIEDRHNITSTVVCSQLPIEKWHECIGDPTIADAICDRLIHNAHKIKLKGESMRKIYSSLPYEDKGIKAENKC